jgi:hypothetical protein
VALLGLGTLLKASGSVAWFEALKRASKPVLMGQPGWKKVQQTQRMPVRALHLAGSQHLRGIPRHDIYGDEQVPAVVVGVLG